MTTVLNLNESEISNLITACKTSAMRTGSPAWQAGLDAIADKLYAAREPVVISDVRAEFGDYGEALPAIPFLFDASWHNDICPVLRDITGDIELWCDYADPAKREFAETPRYSLHVDGEVVISGETLDPAILGTLREALINSMMRTWNYARESAAYALDGKGFTKEFLI